MRLTCLVLEVGAKVNFPLEARGKETIHPLMYVPDGVLVGEVH